MLSLNGESLQIRMRCSQSEARQKSMALNVEYAANGMKHRLSISKIYLLLIKIPNIQRIENLLKLRRTRSRRKIVATVSKIPYDGYGATENTRKPDRQVIGTFSALCLAGTLLVLHPVL